MECNVINNNDKINVQFSFLVSTQGEGQQLVKLAAVNSRPKSSHGSKQTPPVLTITDLEQKLRKKVDIEC